MKKVFIVVLVLFCVNVISHGQNGQVVKNLGLPKFKTSVKTKLISETLVGYQESSDCGRVEIYYIQFENSSQNQSIIKYEKNKPPKLWYDKITYRFLIDQLKNNGYKIVKTT